MAAETATVRNTTPAEIRNANIDLLLSSAEGTIRADAEPRGETLKRFTPCTL
jgi:hypothetical protein